jgi:hypothetical protein
MRSRSVCPWRRLPRGARAFAYKNMTLEELQPNAAVRGILPDQVVSVVSVQWFGSAALELTYKGLSGRLANELLYRHDEARIQVVEHGRPWSFDGDGHFFRLVSEAHRIRLAHLFDPVLAVHTSLVEQLPHQITAVYEVMLPRQPLRFLLAEDPGASKTIMAGLLIKELIVRGDLQRCLIVCPGSLAEQWQDELYRRFQLPFEILLARYERIAFEKTLILIAPQGQPLAAFICPGHPLLDATPDLTLNRHRDLLRRGTVLVDEGDPGTIPRVLFYLEYAVQDASVLKSGDRRTIFKQMLYVELDVTGKARHLHYAPYLDYRPLQPTDPTIEVLFACPESSWITRDLEEKALTHAIAEVADAFLCMSHRQHWSTILPTRN